MEKIKSIIERLQSTSGRNDKIKILEEYKGNTEWEGLLKFLFDPMVVTGISTAKLAKKVEPMATKCQDLLGFLSYLTANNTGRDADLAAVQGFLNANANHRLWLSAVVTKSLKLGIEVSTLNKVYGKGFIDVFEVMLAESLADNPEHLNGKRFIVTQKLDGLRCVAFVYPNNEVKFFTRNGQDYGEVPEVAEELLKMNARNVAYDGELIAKSKSTDTNEVFRETSSVARKDGIKTGLIYHVFDMVGIGDFKKGVGCIPCSVRKEWIHNTLGRQELNWVKEVEILYQGDDQSKIIELSKMAEAKGWEGLMVNVADSVYECKRTRNLLKVKKFITVDVRVTGVYEGTNKNVGRLGGINVEFDFDGKVYTSDCGSGFNDEERVKYWKNPELLIGKIIELKTFEVSKNKDGGRSLRFPIWIDVIRFDKDTTSIV